MIDYSRVAVAPRKFLDGWCVHRINIPSWSLPSYPEIVAISVRTDKPPFVEAICDARKGIVLRRNTLRFCGGRQIGLGSVAHLDRLKCCSTRVLAPLHDRAPSLSASTSRAMGTAQEDLSWGGTSTLSDSLDDSTGRQGT